MSCGKAALLYLAALLASIIFGVAVTTVFGVSMMTMSVVIIAGMASAVTAATIIKVS